MKTIKCLWCGQTVGLTKNGQRPVQHKNGATQCVGSGQPVVVHENQRKLIEQQKKDK